jgi:hypothetical protein
MTNMGNLWNSFGVNGKNLDPIVPCYESHPVLTLGNGGKLWGGNCQFPVVKNADIYVVLQAGGESGLMSDPWDEQTGMQEIIYTIQDMQAPRYVARFKKMIDWLCNQLQLGRKVHVGCIGGHGRTGIVLSAIVRQLTGEIDSIRWVRAHYCKKAVESSVQVEFLVKHYGVLPVDGYKSELYSTPVTKKSKDPTVSKGGEQPILLDGKKTTRLVRSAPSNRSLWRKDKLSVVKAI